MELDQRVEERTRDLVESQQRLRALAAELSLAERKVRKEIATELHDYLAKMLIVTRLKLIQATQEAKEHTNIQQTPGDDGVGPSGKCHRCLGSVFLLATCCHHETDTGGPVSRGVLDSRPDHRTKSTHSQAQAFF